MHLLERLISLLTPDDCLNCGREGALLCAACAARLTPPSPRCFGCDVKITPPAIGCPDCRRKLGVTGLTAAAQHTSTAAELVSRLKFQGNRSAARVMARRLLAAAALPPGALLVNVPATNRHIRERGFDQAALIARELARAGGLPYRSILMRTGRKHQFGSDKTTRLQQLKGAVRVIGPAAVNGRHIVLVDDVLTTGASVAAAAKALQDAGARRVDAWVFARAGRL